MNAAGGNGANRQMDFVTLPTRHCFQLLRDDPSSKLKNSFATFPVTHLISILRPDRAGSESVVVYFRTPECIKFPGTDLLRKNWSAHATVGGESVISALDAPMSTQICRISKLRNHTTGFTQ